MDERKIKQDNFRRSEISTQKWGETGRFQEIINKTKSGLNSPTTPLETIPEETSSELARVRPEPDYPAGNRNGTGIPVPVNRNRIHF